VGGAAKLDLSEGIKAHYLQIEVHFAVGFFSWSALNMELLKGTDGVGSVLKLDAV
jgi:hypothetical protein